jgi:hypothetical protein
LATLGALALLRQSQGHPSFVLVVVALVRQEIATHRLKVEPVGMAAAALEALGLVERVAMGQPTPEVGEVEEPTSPKALVATGDLEWSLSQYQRHTQHHFPVA